MIDIFLKSRVEPSSRTPVLKLASPPSIDSAWRIGYAIDEALKTAEGEVQALACRIDHAMARAAISGGNGNDEYLDREAPDTHRLNLCDAEIREGSQHVTRLRQNIEVFKSLRSALLSAFPEISRKFEGDSTQTDGGQDDLGANPAKVTMLRRS